MKKIFAVVVVAVLAISLTGCPTSQINKEAAWRNEIMKTDRDFSELSRQKGMKKAFIEYIDNEGILLRPNHLPIVGAEAIDYLSRINDSSFTLTWRPSSAHVAASGDLGFTYGVYSLQLKDSSFDGTYVSIWKKQKDGKWKFVLDSGNPGTSDISDSTGH